MSEELERLRALSDAATPGPWTERPNHKPYHIVVFGGRKAYDAGLTTSDIEAVDARLIVAAVNERRHQLARPSTGARLDVDRLLDGIRDEVREAILEADAQDCSSADCVADAVYEIVRVRLIKFAIPGAERE